MSDPSISARSYYELQATVTNLLSEAVSQDIERRRYQREPLLASVQIQSDGETWQQGFTRDISEEGVGLLHSFPLDPGEVVIKISCPGQKPKPLKVNLEWCKTFDENCFISGGRFVAWPD